MRPLLRSLLVSTTVTVCLSALPLQPDAIHAVQAGPPGAGAQPGQGEPQDSKRRDQRVSGKVVDRDGKAVERAEVRFDGPKKDKVFTNARGEFSFSGPAGDYAVVVKAGSRQGNFAVQIDDNQLRPSSTLIIDPEG